MNDSTNRIGGALARHTAAAAGVGTATTAQNDLVQLLGALVAVASLAWSIWEKHRPTPPPSEPWPPSDRGGKHHSSTLMLLLCGVLAWPLLTGCKTMTTDQKLALTRTVATEAAYVGAALALEDDPAHRAKFVLAQEALTAIVAREDFSPANLRAALNGLPALTGASGALLDAGLSLYIVGTGFVDISSAPYVEAVTRGARDGLTRALARPTGPALRVLAPPLPKPCVVPAR